MLRIKALIILGLLSSLVYGQSDSDFPAELIKEAQIDSCIIKCESAANYPQKYSFDKEGRIKTFSFPTAYHPQSDSSINGRSISTYYYDTEGRLLKKTERSDFGESSIKFQEKLSECFIYDLNNKLISHLFYYSTLSKLISYQYDENQLISEITYNFSGNSKSEQPEVQTTKVFYRGTDWISYDKEAKIQDSLVSIVDSSNFKETTFNYHFKNGRLVKDHTEEWIAFFNKNWQMIELLHKRRGLQWTTKIYRAETGLITKIVQLGEDTTEYSFEYK
ncbi:hypothetical protein [Croceimicrobium hydrocarbonivorans]|uniref:YD repeat-containing protein n=1 Tax=Croceimicrobium hydrocarbonivorans TaxID=2761580 RepID=A0A7H0VDP7_9FLAO|nr:hypothetical protein [Croceimicrobium hydrocarbonivorans]QNR23845.1 hypothetical protein H4K34_15935 [Croceimicrobium hydrocarbonivorans]